MDADANASREELQRSNAAIERPANELSVARVRGAFDLCSADDPPTIAERVRRRATRLCRSQRARCARLLTLGQL